MLKPSNSPPSNGWIGSTTGACSSRSETSRPPRRKPPIMPSLSPSQWPRRTQTNLPPGNPVRFTWSAVEWIADADLTRASFYWDSVPHCGNLPSACQVRGRAIPCSDCAKKRHAIIPNRLALVFEESVSVVTGGTRRLNQENPTHAHLHHWQ